MDYPEEFEDECQFHAHLATRYVRKRQDAFNRGIEFNLTLPQFIRLFQRRTCAYTGEKLCYTQNTDSPPDNQASLDRIDNDLGYIPGNVVLCSHKINKIKGALTLKEMHLIMRFLQKHSQTA